MRDYVTNLMFMINGPGTIEDKSRTLYQAIGQINEVTNSGIFASDCLITWAKSMGFLEDELFIKCINDRLTKDQYQNNAILGTIWRRHLILWAAHYCLGVDGDYAELGCYEGDTARMVIDYTNLGKTSKTYWLYDIFDNDGSISEKRPAHSSSLFKETVEKSKDSTNVKIIKGIVPESFIQGAPKKISFLHIDLNNASSERAVLEVMYPLLENAGIAIFDDYGWIQNRPQKDTIDEFMKTYNKKVFELPTGQGLVIK